MNLKACLRITALFGRVDAFSRLLMYSRKLEGLDLRQVKRIAFAVFVGILTTIFLTYFSLRNEEQHLKNCSSLGVDCEQGQIHRTKDRISTWLKTLFERSEAAL